MKHSVKIVGINIVVIACLVVILELVLRFAGMKTIYQMEKQTPKWEKRYKKICPKLLKNGLKIFDDLYTGKDGIFRANPKSEYFLQKKFQGTRINSQGFRGNEFSFVDTPCTKILLIGDSFTWGASAVPLINSFADLIQNAGYHLYNAGIPGTDPIQYVKIAEKYTSQLKPHVVAVCLYLGNDLRRFPRPVQPSKNLHYRTSVGFLRGYDDNYNYFKDVNEAINYMKKRKCGYCDNVWDLFIYKTVIGRAIYGISHRSKKNYREATSKTNREWVKESLQRIQQVCRKNDSEFLLFLIPVVKRNQRKGNTFKDSIHIFKDLQFYYPYHIQSNDYHPPPNAHFNNQCHRKFADFIIEILKKRGHSCNKISGN